MIQKRVIHALFMREILTRYGRHNIGFLWLFVDPMIFIALIGVFWQLTKGNQFSTVSTLAFAVTGYSSVHLWRSMPAQCMSAILPNSTLLYHRQVRPMDFYLARILLEGMGVTMATSFLIFVLAGGGWMPWPADPLQLILAWILLAWFGAALGLLIGPLSERSALVGKIWAPISYLMFPLSGAFFLTYQLPPQVREFMLWIPMVHGVEYMREGYFGAVVPFFYDLLYLIACNLGLTLLGLTQVRWVSRGILVE
jgi:ABC-type polysaccharide/polyol phosphate export permease